MAMTNEQMAAYIRSMGDLSAEEMALQEQLAYSRSLREGLPQGRHAVDNITRALGGIGEGLARKQYGEQLGRYGANKKRAVQGAIDLLVPPKADTTGGYAASDPNNYQMWQNSPTPQPVMVNQKYRKPFDEQVDTGLGTVPNY